MGEEVRVWYDEEGDYLEVLFAKGLAFLPVARPVRALAVD